MFGGIQNLFAVTISLPGTLRDKDKNKNKDRDKHKDTHKDRDKPKVFGGREREQTLLKKKPFLNTNIKKIEQTKITMNKEG